MSDSYVVFRLDRAGRPSSGSAAPPAALAEWTPSLTKIVPGELLADRDGFAKNWVFHLPSILLGGPAYKVFFLSEHAEVVSQCLVTGPSKRFPFMQSRDLQIGLVHTAPKHRGKGYGRRMVSAIVDAHPQCPSYWWLTTDDNIASQKVAEGAGFKTIGAATRISRFGIPHFYLSDAQP
jgi:RimJ/RimL family protein N-acetyltransferase